MELLESALKLLATGAEFLIFTVIIKYILVRWFADRIRDLFKLCFVRTEREISIWLHYRNKAKNQGHRHDTPIDCQDGRCKII